MLELLAEIESYFYNLVLAVAILFAGLTLGLIVRRILLKVLHLLEVDLFIKKAGREYPLEKRASDLAAYLIYLLSLVLFFRQLGMTSAVFYALFSFLALLLALVIFFGIKDFFPNFFAGMAIRYRRSEKEGKKIRYLDIEGKIKKISWLEIEIETEKGENIHISNSLFLRSKKAFKK